MAKVSLAQHMQEHRHEPESQPEKAGPFITISRQYGCWGFSLALLLRDILNEEVAPGRSWNIYHKEILDRLASETNMEAEELDRHRRAKPKRLVDFFRTLSGKKVPSGHEIRNRMAELIRDLAVKGYAIVVGQGGAGATHDLPKGLSVRLEAPQEWRIGQIAFREGLTPTQAKLRMNAKEAEKEYLRKLYQTRFRRTPAFNLMYDCSVFTLAQIAQQTVRAMKLKGCV